MIDTSTEASRNFGARCLSLSSAAHTVRQRAIRRGHDLAGWRLARMMRDAHTIAQIKSSEREYRIWLISNRIGRNL